MKNAIISHKSLKNLNTFAIEAIANQYIKVEDETVLNDLFNEKLFEKEFFVLGGGSNVLFTKDYPGLLIHIANKGKQHFIEGNNVFVTAAAGEVWNDLVWYCIEHDFPGLENMALIPGTVGASPIQNIGAYGQELMHIFYSCRAFDTLTGEFVTFTNEDCQFSYRDSIFKREYRGRFIICSVTYKLELFGKINTSYGAIESELQNRGIQNPTIKDVAEVVSFIRVEKLPDPSTVGNAGSFFKNPIISKSKFLELLKQFPQIVHYSIDTDQEKLAAGWLIEQCGWKGKAVGQVAVWKNQALVLTNVGNATGNEIFNVSSTIVDDVNTQFGVLLEREVNIL
ncbi:UDP-N-acetylenolpyruvoylglucosamine reductase [Sphingobacterium cellulitidis]|uniref:UDP-N-acetylmuramate dehydrogenase n=1 Tax=Sphingobacterium cellulitidis TaxID=1768011 RepID=UPI000B9450B9|nr:UDP-N-acetylmuramate dehydrogenase [Sphingobacterium cellulitidis]OYD47420.1 UDP-N-acetylenolpyruvoylglucosamine reductase [Sphingobacterium cellulitidis]